CCATAISPWAWCGAAQRLKKKPRSGRHGTRVSSASRRTSPKSTAAKMPACRFSRAAEISLMSCTTRLSMKTSVIFTVRTAVVIVTNFQSEIKMNLRLQSIIDRLPNLTPAELGVAKAAVDEELTRQLRAMGVQGDLTTDEWKSLDENDPIRCIKKVRDRTGLGLRDSKAYVDQARTKGRPPIRSRLEDSDLGSDFGNGGRWEGSRLEDSDLGSDFGNGGRWEGHK